MDRAAVDEWVARYLQAWRSNDPVAIANLFAEHAEYLTGPFDEPWRGRQAIVEGWLARPDEPGSWTFEVLATHVAEDAAFVEGRAGYPSEGLRFANLWEIRLDERGQATRYVEWWMEPRKTGS
jgi:uncharacterized protein (TIGR02246 family)